MAVSVGPGVTTFQCTMNLAAATSTALTTGNVTLVTGTSLPTAFNQLTIINTGTNAAYISWFGGTASTGGGCEPLAGGASDTVNLGGSTIAPTLYSTLGTLLAIRN